MKKKKKKKRSWKEQFSCPIFVRTLRTQLLIHLREAASFTILVEQSSALTTWFGPFLLKLLPEIISFYNNTFRHIYIYIYFLSTYIYIYSSLFFFFFNPCFFPEIIPSHGNTFQAYAFFWWFECILFLYILYSKLFRYFTHNTHMEKYAHNTHMQKYARKTFLKTSTSFLVWSVGSFQYTKVG